MTDDTEVRGSNAALADELEELREAASFLAVAARPEDCMKAMKALAGHLDEHWDTILTALRQPAPSDAAPVAGEIERLKKQLGLALEALLILSVTKNSLLASASPAPLSKEAPMSLADELEARVVVHGCRTERDYIEVPLDLRDRILSALRAREAPRHVDRMAARMGAKWVEREAPVGVVASDLETRLLRKITVTVDPRLHGLGPDAGKRRKKLRNPDGPEAVRALAAHAAEVARLERVAFDLQSAEANYRNAHDLYGDGHTKTGRAWDLMRRAGDAVRAVTGYIARNQKGSGNG